MIDPLALSILVVLVSPYIAITFLVLLFGQRHVPRSVARDGIDSARKPLVSVFIPTFNEEKTIAKKLDNLMAQSYPIHEVLVYDCSTDSTRSIVEQFQTKYPQIRLVRQTHRSGPARTLNHAISEATGEILIKTDADVSLKSSNAIGDLVKYFEDSQVGAACATFEKESGLEARYRSIMARIQSAESAIDSTLIGHSGLLAIRMSASGMVNPLSMAEDSEQFIVVRKNGYRTVIAPDVKVDEEIPSTFLIRRKQRDRRAAGILRAILDHKDMLLNPKFGKYGMIVLPMEFFIVGLSPFFMIAIAALSCYLAFQLNPLYLCAFTIPFLFLLAKSKLIFSVVDTQLSGLIATSRILTRRTQQMWPKVR